MVQPWVCTQCDVPADCPMGRGDDDGEPFTTDTARGRHVAESITIFAAEVLTRLRKEGKPIPQASPSSTGTLSEPS